MTITSGFFDAREDQGGNPDRLYNADQMSSLFDGIITEGVFRNIGSAFSPTVVSNSRTVRIGVGRAWVNGKWIYNNSSFSVEIPASPTSPNDKRIDTIALEMDLSEAVRQGNIVVVSGLESQNPIKPSLANTGTKKQVAICHVTSQGGTSYVRQADVQYVVGTSENPYIEFISESQTSGVVPIIRGGTGSNNKSGAKANLGIIIGTTDPEEMASQLDTNDIYIYITD